MTSKLSLLACCAPLSAPTLSDEEAESTAALFKALADPARVRIVNLLAARRGEVCACEFEPALGLSQPTVSHHLRKLTDTGLLDREQRGKWAYFSLNSEAAARLAGLVDLRRLPVSTAAADQLREQVRERYAAAAKAVGEGSGSGCCGSRSCCSDSFGESLYSDEQRGDLPGAAALASLGCGNPTAVADLRDGESVLDLGSGGGIDVILSARRVGPTGLAYGLDMTDEMLALARRNAEEAGVRNAIFLKGVIENVPLPAESVDVVISNCVVNLSTDKAAVLTEIARVLKPGGRLGISDVVAEDHLSPEERADRGSYVGCIAGALSKAEYEAGLEAAGLTDVSVEFTHEFADGMHGATISAVKPAAWPSS
jgi:DNA-binding transcriptional ArsR family regulator/SAM-dependent methyltransferase